MIDSTKQKDWKLLEEENMLLGKAYKEKSKEKRGKMLKEIKEKEPVLLEEEVLEACAGGNTDQKVTTMKCICRQCGWNSQIFRNPNSAFDAAMKHNQETRHWPVDIAALT